MTFMVRWAPMMSLSLRLLASAARMALLLMLAHFLPANDFADYGLLAATAGYAVYAIGMDFYTYSTREIIKVDRTRWPSFVNGHALVTLTAYGLALPSIWWLAEISIVPKGYMALLGTIILFEHASQELYRMLAAVQRPLAAAVVLFARSAAWVFPVLLALVFLPESRNLQFVLVSWTAGGVSAVLLGGGIVLSMMEWRWTIALDLRWIVRGVRVAIPFLISTLALRFIHTGDRFWIEMLTDQETLAAYLLLTGFAAILPVILESAVYSFLVPRMISAWSMRKPSEFRFLVRKMWRQSIFIIVGYTVSMPVVMVLVLEVAGKQAYASQAWFIPWVMLPFTLHALAMIPHYALYAQGRDRFLIFGNIVAMLAFCVAGYIAARWMGVVGVLLGIVIAFAMIGIVSAWAYYRLTPGDFRGSQIFS